MSINNGSHTNVQEWPPRSTHNIEEGPLSFLNINNMLFWPACIHIPRQSKLKMTRHVLYRLGICHWYRGMNAFQISIAAQCAAGWGRVKYIYGLYGPGADLCITPLLAKRDGFRKTVTVFAFLDILPFSCTPRSPLLI